VISPFIKGERGGFENACKILLTLLYNLKVTREKEGIKYIRCHYKNYRKDKLNDPEK